MLEGIGDKLGEDEPARDRPVQAQAYAVTINPVTYGILLYGL